jgi:excisionase family DNA binding protein
MFMTVKQAAEKWGISERRVRVLCAEGRIPGSYKQGRGWRIPLMRHNLKIGDTSQ